MPVFAAFAVVRLPGDEVWAIARPNRPKTLPGGVCRQGEHPVQTVRREAAEGGLHLCGDGKLLYVSPLDNGITIQWYEFPAAIRLSKPKLTRAVIVTAESVFALSEGLVSNKAQSLAAGL